INDPINQNTTNPIFNDTQAKIRNFITRAYQLWGTEYVLIGGDNDIVPARYLWYWNHDNESDQYNDSLPSDLYYSCLDGSYNADNDSYWGEPQDGEFYTGDEYEPAGGGAFYVEADCEDLPSTIFNVGLFTPSLNLSNLPDPSNVSLDFECYFVSANLGDYINVSVYSGGKNEENFEETLYYNTNGSLKSIHITRDLDLENYTDPSDVYIRFYYNTDFSQGKSFNIDDVKVWCKNDSSILEVFWESFEKMGWAPGNDSDNWTQIKYEGTTGGWMQEAYVDDLDLIAEVYVGRACVSDINEVSNFVKKTLAYDNMSNRDLAVKKALMVGLQENLFFWGDFNKMEIENGSSDQFVTHGIPKDRYLVDHLYDGKFNGSNYLPNYWPIRMFYEKINDGVSIVNWGSHGYWNYFIRYYYFFDQYGVKLPFFTIYHAKKLSNNKYFFIYSYACLVGEFDHEGDDCLSEWLTVKTPNGAFAAVMNSRTGWGGLMGGGSSQKYDRQFFDAIFGENIYELGKANQDSKEDNLPFLKLENDKEYLSMRQCYYELNLFGDPQISIKIPEVNHPPNTPATPDIYSKNLRWYTFTTSTTDPDNDSVQYKFRIDDQELSLWTKSYNSGETAYRIIRIPIIGIHNISVKARDIFGNESEWSVNKTVTASFDSIIQIDSNTAVLGEQIQISGQATGGIEPYNSWYYDFGDGNNSFQQNPIYTYNNLGNYTITLTVTDNQNITSNTTKVINVVLLKSDFNSSSVYSIPDETFFFNDTSNGYYNIINWSWDFGDGNTSYNQNPSHEYSSEGTYNVSLTVSDDESNTDVYYQTIFIDTTNPVITSVSNNLDDIGYGSNVIINANITDNISGIKNVKVNITCPNDTYRNCTMNNTNDSNYEYMFSDTWKLGVYNYQIWVVDNADNSNSLPGNSFNVIRYLGHHKIGCLNQTIWNVITGSVFKVNKNGVAENITVYIDPGNATSESHYQCMIYRHNDS
ncbi:MAG: C25 family cysteine peptidase, partial [Thermoplasmatota archaeon]